MQNFNEVLPKYRLLVNGSEVTLTEDRLLVMSDYKSAVDNGNINDVVEVLENSRVITSTLVGDAL